MPSIIPPPPSPDGSPRTLSSPHVALGLSAAALGRRKMNLGVDDEKAAGMRVDDNDDNDNDNDDTNSVQVLPMASFSSSRWSRNTASTGTKDVLDLEIVLYNNGLKRGPDGAVGWDFSSPGCDHPRNWPMHRKLWDFGVIVVVEAFVLAMSSVGTPISSHADEALAIPALVSSLVFTSLFLFGQAIGVIIIPASESFGRKKVFVGGMFLFSCGNLFLGLRPSVPVIAICRLLTGVLAAIPMNGIFGSMADLWSYKDRLWVGWIGALAANAGIIMGPVLSEGILQTYEWPWVFLIAASFGLFLTGVLCTTFESRPSVLLRRKTNKIRVLLRNPDLLPARHPDHAASMSHFARKHMARPFKLLVSERIILTTSVLIGLSFAMIFMFLEALPLIFETFHMEENLRTLPFFGLAFGLVFSTYTRMYDHFEISRCLERDRAGLKPELKLIGFLIGSWFFAAGLWLFAWSIPPYAEDVPMTATLALVMVGYGINEFDTVLTGYLMDAYLAYAGSALAALNFMRTVTIGVCSVFAQDLFHGRDWNHAGSALAAAATLFCIAPPLLMRYGEHLRCRSKFAVFSGIVTLEERIMGSTLTPKSSRPPSAEDPIFLL